MLLAQRTDDPIMEVRQNEMMADAVGKAGKQVKRLISREEIHGLSEQDHRVGFYNRLLAFLEPSPAGRTPATKAVATK